MSAIWQMLFNFSNILVSFRCSFRREKEKTMYEARKADAGVAFAADLVAEEGAVFFAEG